MLKLLILIVLADIIECESVCKFPNACKSVSMTPPPIMVVLETETSRTHDAFVCIVRSGYQLYFESAAENEPTNNCSKQVDIQIRPPRYTHMPLESKAFDFRSFSRFIHLSMSSSYITIEYNSFQGFDIDLYNQISNDLEYKLNNIGHTVCSYCSIKFYKRGKLLNSCIDFVRENATHPVTIFQASSIASTTITLFRSEFQNLCPLAFKNTRFYTIHICGLIDTFYSRKLMTFSDDTFSDLQSSITNLHLCVDNIDLDLNFLHPTVFSRLKTIRADGPIRTVHSDLFVSLPNLVQISLQTEYFRSLMHSSGIDWIKNINKNLHVNLNAMNASNETNLDYDDRLRTIGLDCINNALTLPMSNVFPDEDFCLYKDFPFDQLVLILQLCESKSKLDLIQIKVSCTYLWLTQYYNVYKEIIKIDKFKLNINWLVHSDEFRRAQNQCDLESMKKRCDKSNFQIKPLKSLFDVGVNMVLTKTIFNISTYVVCIFGLITNVIVVVTVSKMNTSRSNLAQHKKYGYMRINAVCNCIVLAIELMSWLTDCVYPEQVFCPEFRKEVFMQYFKIVKDLLMVVFRFMNSFSYAALGFNRIAALGKNQNSLVKFFSDYVGMKTYVLVTMFISVGFSVIKFFQFRINYDQSSLDYPIPIDNFVILDEDSVEEAVSIVNLVSDLLNYGVLSFVILSIDIAVVVSMHRKLIEKMNEEANRECTNGFDDDDDDDDIYDANNQAASESAAVEVDEVDPTSICVSSTFMVIEFMLKLPLLVYPIVNMAFENYMKNESNVWTSPGFARFYIRYCVDAFVCDMFLYLARFLYSISITIPLFFYKDFDYKFRSTYNQVFC